MQDHLDLSEEIAIGVRAVGIGIATLIIAAIAMTWLGLWAENRPDRPPYCAGLSAADCTAAAQMRGVSQ